MKNPNTDKIRETFAKILRIKRHELGLSQEELAHRAGLTMRYISLLECNKRQPTISTLFALGYGLEVSVSEMMGEVETELS